MLSTRWTRAMPLAACLGLLACGKAPASPALVETPPQTPASEPPAAPHEALAPVERDLHAEAQDVLERRCIVCHGCYDAPCQLKLDGPDGLHRGANKRQVYDAARVRAVTPTRLGIDATSTEQWRELGFFAVWTPDATGAAKPDSPLLRMLKLKREHPLPDAKLLPDSMPVGLEHKAVCPTTEEMDDFEQEHPLWGMPYALPPVADEEQAQLERWLADGAPRPEPSTPSDTVLAQVERWERFFNGDDPKTQLMARYIYEHLFLATIDVEEDASSVQFRLVRSRTPSGFPIDEIPTRRPFDDPEVERVYYRLRVRHAVQLSKTHMPYALNDARMRRWTQLFLAPEYEVTALPSYDLEAASNPFLTFEELPVRARYAFMLDEAQFTLMGFIKGPVCRGQVALDVIQDHFWVTFVQPDSQVIEAEARFLKDNAAHLALPAHGGSNASLTSWIRYSRNQKKYLKAKSEFLEGLAKKHGGPSLSYVWDGHSKSPDVPADPNPNAALTVFRHFDNATVAKGFVGSEPKTSWVLGYGVLERIHYLLVAGFDVFGNVSHQLNTRLYMDFLRMEAEHNFLALLPSGVRKAKVDAWYEDVGKRVKSEVFGSTAHLRVDSVLEYHTDDPQHELYGMLRAHLGEAVQDDYSLAAVQDDALRGAMQRLHAVRGKAASLLPELAFIRIEGEERPDAYFTLVRNSMHSNVAHLFREEARRRRSEDYLSVLHGWLGAYPNAFWSVPAGEADALVAQVSMLAEPEDYEALLDRYGVRRTDPAFWAHSDRLKRARSQLSPTDSEAGLLDYNRLENR